MTSFPTDRVTNGNARKATMAAKPVMHVNIKNHYQAKVYTTSSVITGHVSLKTQREVRFDSIQISLVGLSKTRMDGVGTPASVSHTFLKLTMPVPESAYPTPRVVEPDQTLNIPFDFVIPDHLTLNACNHMVSNQKVRDYHMRLPPTMGAWEKEDFAPDMAQVKYFVRARLYRQDVKTETKILEASQPIRVIPEAAEEPPLSVTETDKLYAMSKSKALRKTILSPKMGDLTAWAVQPPTAMMSYDAKTIADTTAQIDLRFEPVSHDVAPPKVTSVNSKITAVTFFSASGVKNMTNLGEPSRNFGGADRVGSYSGSTPLPPCTVAAISWTKHEDQPSRRSSGCDSGDDGARRKRPKMGSRTTSKDNVKQSLVRHTASLQVPVSLPADKKTFIPTFHSCISSRVYVLNLSVNISTGGITSSVTLNVPLQIGKEPLMVRSPSEDGLPTFEDAVEEAEADEYLRPRHVGSGSGSAAVAEDVGFHHTLPGYRDFAAGPTVAAH